MKAAVRAALVIVASLAIAAGGVTGVRAADPTAKPTVGGTLSAAGNTITVLSNGNVPAHIVLTATNVSLSESAFNLQPGQSHSVTFSGKAVGTVSADYSVAPAPGQEAGSARLVLNLQPRVPPATGGPSGGDLLAVLIAVAALFVIRKVRPWRYRLVARS